MSRRKPGQSAIVTQRKEPDDVQFLSGILKEKQPVQSVLYLIQIRNQTIILILKITIDPAMRIMFMKNTEPAIIAVVDVVLRENGEQGSSGCNYKANVTRY
jgi:hypothetical protein